MTFSLTQADYVAIAHSDDDYLNNKGAKYYVEEDYETAIEYYRLAAAMGNTHSVSNLGYCYMYARSIPQNMDLALAYFQVASANGDIDATYKLGNIYKHGADGIEQNDEMAIYYYHKAVEAIFSFCGDEPSEYPSLFLSVAKEHMPHGLLNLDAFNAYQFLIYAQTGYKRQINDGAHFYTSALAEVEKLMQDPFFDEVKIDILDDEEDIED